MPAYGCGCEWCGRWKRDARDILPADLRHQLLRLGIRVEQPADLYTCESAGTNPHCRLVYYAVGKLLSGPATSREDPRLGSMFIYQELRAEPRLLSLAVFPVRDRLAIGSIAFDPAHGDLLRIDVRLQLRIS
jgi:hypothetical protein